jgi:hypothetical protein
MKKHVANEIILQSQNMSTSDQKVVIKVDAKK